jgi:hypothetical protein
MIIREKPVAKSRISFHLLPPPMLSNQTPRLTTKPNMWPRLPILQTMLINNIINLFRSTTVRAQRREALSPAVKEDGLVEKARRTFEFSSDGRCYAGEAGDEGVNMGGFDNDGEGQAWVWRIIGEVRLKYAC